MPRIIRKGFLLLVLAVLSTSQGFAQDASTAKETARFTDWGRTCDKLPGTDEDVCLLFQRLRMKDTDQVLLTTTVAINPKDKTTVVTVTVPLGVLLPPGMQMKVDQAEPILKAPFLICMQVGCRASAIMDETMVKAMQSGKQLLVAFVNANRKPATVPVSLGGFAEAYKTLKK